MNLMERAILCLCFLLIVPALARAEGNNGSYDYPIDDSYAATILGTPQNLRPDNPERRLQWISDKH